MLSKTSRQLAVFHIFFFSKVVELKEITSLIKVDAKTIMRDINELQSAGLIKVRYSRRENGYVHTDSCCPFSQPSFSENKAKNRHLEKLIRLASVMVGLRYHKELPYYHENSENQETCSSWYKNRFPDVSTRTMWRDFEELGGIGYLITYNHDDKCYSVDFPEDLEGLQSRFEALEV